MFSPWKVGDRVEGLMVPREQGVIVDVGFADGLKPITVCTDSGGLAYFHTEQIRRVSDGAVFHAVAPDCGFEAMFLEEVSALLADVHDIYSHVEYPGILVVYTDWGGPGERGWATGLTGLHLCSNDGSDDAFPGGFDDRVIALERDPRGFVSAREYANALAGMLRVAEGC